MTLETRLRLNYLLSQYKTKYEKYYSKEDFEYVVGSFISNFESRESVGTLLLQAYVDYQRNYQLIYMEISLII